MMRGGTSAPWDLPRKPQPSLIVRKHHSPRVETFYGILATFPKWQGLENLRKDQGIVTDERLRTHDD